MTNLLYINASPRGDLSAANQAASIFTDALADSVHVNRLDLFDAKLPEITLESNCRENEICHGPRA